MESPGIALTTYEESPWDAWERNVVKFTYKERSFEYIIPDIILASFNLVIGIVAMKIGANVKLANWLFFAAASAFVGNALPKPMRFFTGNLGECAMQFGLLQAILIVYRGDL